jgi:hypothetical protein
MNKIGFLAASFLAILPVTAAVGDSLGWPQTIDLLTQERSQAETCVGLLKSSGDQSAIANAKAIYGTARADMDGVIAGLTTALVEGGKPESLPTVRASLEGSGKSLRGDRQASRALIWSDWNRPAIQGWPRSVQPAVDRQSFAVRRAPAAGRPIPTPRSCKTRWTWKT